MERRYERLSAVRARNLPEANRAFRQRGEDALPYLLVVIDELADLMMVSPQAVEDAVIRLAQKSRAVGIHLVLATQRPSVDVITGMIKANVPSRIAFAVSTQTDSRVILDQAGAESLLGQGDMLFKPLGTSRLQRVQGAYVTEEEIALVVEQCRAPARAGARRVAARAAGGVRRRTTSGDDGEFDPDEDPLLEKAIEIVVQTQTASVSLLQRRLRVGYTRAGRLIDMLERRGIISGYEGSKPRRVLVDEADLDRVLAGLLTSRGAASRSRPRPSKGGHMIRTGVLACTLMLAAPSLALGAATVGEPSPSDRSTVIDKAQLTGLRVALPRPDCAAFPSDCDDIDVLNTLDGFNVDARVSIPFSGPIDLATVRPDTVFFADRKGNRVALDRLVWTRRRTPCTATRPSTSTSTRPTCSPSPTA